MAFNGRFILPNKKSSDSDGSNSSCDNKVRSSENVLINNKSTKIKMRSGPLLQKISILFGSSDISSPENLISSWEQSADEQSPDIRDAQESESPHSQPIHRVTSDSRKRRPTHVKSFSHELNSKGVEPFPFWKPRSLYNIEEVLVMVRERFEKAKEEIDSDLAVFAADLVVLLENNTEKHPGWQETIEDLLILAQSCAMTSPNEFWLRCESIVQELDDKLQELPLGTLKQLHMRMYFILTRCTRLLQFHKESG